MRLLLFPLALGAALSLAPAAHGAGGLLGKWRDPVTEGRQETLTLFSNGAYKSETALVDPDALKAKIAEDCRVRAKRFRKVRCNQAALDKEFETWSNLYPSVFIGTYEVVGARIEFTHGCAEDVEGCKIGQTTDSAIFFVDGDTLTIKFAGIRYKGRVIGGGSYAYTRQP